MRTEDTVILALDGLGNNAACDLVEAVGQRVFAVKIHDLADDQGLEVVNRLKAYGAARVWVDYKLHDIPETVRKRAMAIAKHGADIVSVHASGGTEMMRAAAESGLITYAVTVLTSLTEAQVQSLYHRSTGATVIELAWKAAEAGLSGLVCSPQEVEMLDHSDGLAARLQFITPGIRSIGADTHDQARIGTPEMTLRHGASKLVIGRQVTLSKDPRAQLDRIAAEIEPV